MANQISAKQLQINKTNANIVVAVSIAAIVVAFSLVSIKALLEQRSYQSRVIKQQTASLKVAKADVPAAQQLAESYKSFEGQQANIIGGSAAGAGAQDGTNSKIVLDALPSQYDFPALIGSMDKFLTSRGVTVDSISGIDDAALGDTTSAVAPTAVPVPFQFSVSGPYQAIQAVVSALDKSILPISVNKMEISGSESQTKMTVDANAFYQPAKNLKTTTKVVK